MEDLPHVECHVDFRVEHFPRFFSPDRVICHDCAFFRMYVLDRAQKELVFELTI